jgi:hypothetical protein
LSFAHHAGLRGSAQMRTVLGYLALESNSLQLLGGYSVEFTDKAFFGFLDACDARRLRE